MLEIGAFHPAWNSIHLGPENALAAHALLGGGPLLPIHWGTFNLALHPWDEPIETLLELAPAAGARLLLPRLGEAHRAGARIAASDLVARRGCADVAPRRRWPRNCRRKCPGLLIDGVVRG